MVQGRSSTCVDPRSRGAESKWRWVATIVGCKACRRRYPASRSDNHTGEVTCVPLMVRCDYADPGLRATAAAAVMLDFVNVGGRDVAHEDIWPLYRNWWRWH